MIYLTAANDAYANRWRERIHGLDAIDGATQEVPATVTRPTLVFNASPSLAERLSIPLDEPALEASLVRLARETPRRLISGPPSPSKILRW